MSTVALVGPGAIGITFGAAAAQAGHDVLVCSRRPMPDGISVERDDGQVFRVHGPALTDATEAPQVDVVLLATKAHQTEGASTWLRALCRPDTLVVVLQNGVEQEAVARPFVGEAEIVPVVVWCPASVVGLGQVRQREAARLSVPDARVADLLAGSFATVDVSADFPVEAWHKLAQNAVAGLQALVDRPASMFTATGIQDVVRAMTAEIVAVAAAEGVVLPVGLPQLLLDRFASLPAEASTSIRVDRNLGRPLEWDARNGVIVRLAAKHGIAVPVNATVASLLAGL